MAYEHKQNSGSLFKNDKKQKDTDPNAKGDGVIVCPNCQHATDVWISAWTNRAKDGSAYQALKFNAKDEVRAKGMAQAKQAMEPDTFEDSEIPFD